MIGCWNSILRSANAARHALGAVLVAASLSAAMAGGPSVQAATPSLRADLALGVKAID